VVMNTAPASKRTRTADVAKRLRDMDASPLRWTEMAECTVKLHRSQTGSGSPP
jgi:hypothetical protein